MQSNWLLLLYTGMEQLVVGGLREVMRCVEPLLRNNFSFLLSGDAALRKILQACHVSPEPCPSDICTKSGHQWSRGGGVGGEAFEDTAGRVIVGT